jgi:xanthine/uracil permease
MPFKWGFEFNFAIIIGMCFMAIVSAIETVGDTSGITKGGAGREATDKEISGATFADGLGTAVAGVFGGLPNTSFSQNVGLIAMTGVMSRHVVTIGALFLIVCGLIPKVGRHQHRADQRARRRRHRDVRHGLRRGRQHALRGQLEPPQHGDLRHRAVDRPRPAAGAGSPAAPGQDAQILLTSGLLPAALIAIVLNLVLPEDLDD